MPSGERSTTRSCARGRGASSFGRKPRELGGAELLGPLAQRGDERRDLAGRALDPEALELLGDDLAHLARPRVRRCCSDCSPERLEVVDVEQRHAEDLADARVDVARHGDVDDEQRRGRRGAP